LHLIQVLPTLQKPFVFSKVPSWSYKLGNLTIIFSLLLGLSFSEWGLGVHCGHCSMWWETDIQSRVPVSQDLKPLLAHSLMPSWVPSDKVIWVSHPYLCFKHKSSNRLLP
jgi:hypothetical protein